MKATEQSRLRVTLLTMAPSAMRPHLPSLGLPRFWAQGSHIAEGCCSRKGGSGSAFEDQDFDDTWDAQTVI
jgi:hypothetical protein